MTGKMKIEVEVPEPVLRVAGAYHTLVGGEWNTEALKGSIEWLIVKGAESLKDTVNPILNNLFEEISEIE